MSSIFLKILYQDQIPENPISPGGVPRKGSVVAVEDAEELCDLENGVLTFPHQINPSSRCVYLILQGYPGNVDFPALSHLLTDHAEHNGEILRERNRRVDFSEFTPQTIAALESAKILTLPWNDSFVQILKWITITELNNPDSDFLDTPLTLEEIPTND